MKTSDNTIVIWLTRIFTIKTFSILFAAVSAFFAYKTYIDSKSSELLVRFPSETTNPEYTYEFHDVRKITKYWSLIITDIPIIGVNGIYDKMPIGKVMTFPEFINNSEKVYKILSVT